MLTLQICSLAQRERDRACAARHQAARASPPAPVRPLSLSPPSTPSTPEGLRSSMSGDLDTLTTSPLNTSREEEVPSTPNLPATRKVFKWNDDDMDGSQAEANRIYDEMGTTGKCHFCDFECEPNTKYQPCQAWWNPPLGDHLEEVHPETEEWFA